MPVPTPPVRGYQFITFAQAKTALAERLSDPGKIHWIDAELGVYVKEALHCWQAYTSWYREKAALTVTPGVQFYDLALSTLTPTGSTNTYAPNLFGYNITDFDIASWMCYHLIEQQIGFDSGSGAFVWRGTDQFDLTKMRQAIQARICRFLGDSGCVVTYYLQSVAGLLAGPGRVALSDPIIDVRRADWIAQDGTHTTLWRDDEWAMNSFDQGWQTPQVTPSVYSMVLTPPLSVQITPPPSVAGLLELLVVQCNQVLNICGGASTIQVPDDFTWAVKFGALADMLSEDGQSRDSQRAQYCEQRYQQGVRLARVFPAVMEAQVGGVPVWSGSVFELDAFQANWQNASAGNVGYLGYGGRNMVGLSPASDGVQPVTLDLVRNFPQPQSDGDFLQIPRDIIDVILDEAQHVASFKMGGEEFTSTMRLHANFLYAAGEYNGRLRQMAFYNDALRQAGIKYKAEVSRIEREPLAAYANATAKEVEGGWHSSD